MPARRTRKRGALSRSVSGLSLLAACGLLIGAVFILTSNQGCMRAISRRSNATAQQAAPPTQQAEPDHPDSATADKREGKTHKVTQEDKPVDDKAGAGPAETGKTPDQPNAKTGPDPLKDMRTSSTHLGSMGEVSRGSTSSPKIAITLDAGASSVPTDKILKVLAKQGVRCTFFLTGKWIEKNPDLARRIVAEGHEIGNHTYSHPQLTKMSEGAITREIERTEQLVQRATGKGTKPLFRPPYGARDKRVLSILGGLGYRSIYWHVDCWDAVKPGITADQITKRVLSLVGNGSIVLMHCGSQATADALEDLLTQLKARGYKPVTVSDLLN